ncbi:MAG: hypothetical protein LBG60_16980, partial [Bifidobacteriaceae bacterium]|nr:hypothetical protein [Bifidobacteriaceae bacterium]
MASPAFPDHLTDWTRCPGCGRALTGVQCLFCGLPLAGPSGVRLSKLSIAADAAHQAGSSAAFQLLDERAALIARLRHGSPDPAARTGSAGQVPAGQVPAGQLPAHLAAPPSAMWRPGSRPVSPGAPPGPAGWPGSWPAQAPHPGAPVRPAGATGYELAYPQPVPKPPSQWTPTTVLALIGALALAAAAVGYAFLIPELDWLARMAALALATVAAAAGTLFLKARKITATGEAMAAVAAALALLTWAIGLREVPSEEARPAWSAAALLVLAAALYLAGGGAGGRGPRAWRVAGLLAAPAAALYLPALMPAGPAADELWPALSWVGFALLAAAGRKVDRARAERIALEILGGIGLLAAVLLAVANLTAPTDWVIW